MKIAKERVLYDNYDLSETYPDKDIDELLIENGVVEDAEEITDEMRWKERYNEDEFAWDAAKEELDEFFDGKKCLIMGETGLWHGVYHGSDIGEFWELFNKAITDCDYIKIYDINGHFHLTCSHHDGRCHYEFKIVTSEGEEYYDRWNYGSDNRRECDVHKQIYKKYSKIPHFMHKVYGCKVRESEESTKEKLINSINNTAMSFYS